MTKKHYELIAKTIKGRIMNTGHLDLLGWSDTEITAGLFILDDLANFLSYNLEQNDEKFNRSKFLKACGLED